MAMGSVGDAAAGTARSDVELAADLLQGDGTALAEIYDRFHRAVHAVGFRVTTDRTHAEDVVQEVFVALWRKPEAYNPQRASLGTWLMATAHHRAVDLVRREESLRRRRDAVAVEVEQEFRLEQISEPVDDQAGERWQAERVRRALAELPESQRQAMVLAYFGGYTQREVAAVTGVPLGTVKTRMLAAMRKLKDVLAPLRADALSPGPGELRGLEGGAS
ncbi:MAG: sigma-70 family RNA polymerase sigma factor [Actinomycetota bacterium]|nr:sigma-70 family RNA polymerase sigma factor [Actinomycetota bacterium]